MTLSPLPVGVFVVRMTMANLIELREWTSAGVSAHIRPAVSGCHCVVTPRVAPALALSDAKASNPIHALRCHPMPVPEVLPNIGLKFHPTKPNLSTINKFRGGVITQLLLDLTQHHNPSTYTTATRSIVPELFILILVFLKFTILLFLHHSINCYWIGI